MKASIQQLANILISRSKGACPTTIHYETTHVSIVGGKSSPILKDGPIVKQSIVNGIANFLYEAAVNRQREREEQPLTESGAVEIFNSSPRVWGCRLHLGKTLLPFVHHVKGLVQPSHRDIVKLSNLPHADELYLELKCQQTGLVKYLQNGKELDIDYVQQFLREKEEGRRQQVDDVVKLRDFKLQSLKTITIDGKVYEITA
jgi:hypothetical protein